MKKYLIYILFGLFITDTALAQDENHGRSFKDKLFLGGNFGLTFGDYTFINVSPQLDYRFNKFLAAGAGINFEYYKEKTPITLTEDLTTKFGLVGLNVFGRVYPIQYLMLQIQPEANYKFGSVTDYDYSTMNSVKTTAPPVIVPSLLAGGGFVLPSLGGAFIVSVMYDVLQDKDSPYGKKPIVNFGYSFNLR